MIKTAIYNFWEEFQKQYTDDVDLPEGQYKTEDGRVIDKDTLYKEFTEELIKQINKVYQEDIDKEGRYVFLIEKNDLPF